MAKRYSGGVIRFTKSDASTVSVPAAINTAANATVVGDDQGELYDRVLALAGFQPMVQFTTKNIGAILDLVGLAGQCVGSGQSITSVDAIYRRTADCSSALGSTPHIQDRCSHGLLILNALNMPRKQDATISCTLYALSVSGNAPLIRTDGVALPSTISSAQYEMGLPFFGGVAFPECTGLALNFGLNVDLDSALGLIWPTLVSVQTIRPTLAIDDRDLSQITNSIMAAGYVATTHNNTLLQLIKRANSSVFQDFETSVHTALTMDGMITPNEIAGVQPNQRSTHSMNLTARYDGTNAPVVFDTTAEYTAA